MIRLIPRLDIKGPNLVKGIHLEGLRVLGKPEEFARYYYENGADELCFVDAVASLYGRNSLLDLVERTSKQIFIPLTVGGGLRSIADIRAALRAGADKVFLNTAAIQRPELIREASRIFGSSTIVVSIEAIKQPDGSYQAYTNCGREETGLDAINWGIQAAELGAGELLVTSVDREGTGKGFDIDLIRQIADVVPIPVIACGGAGNLSHIAQVIQDGQVDAVSVASMLHYHYVKKMTSVQLQAGAEGNLVFLRSRSGFTMIQDATLQSIKAYLKQYNIECRFIDSLIQC